MAKEIQDTLQPIVRRLVEFYLPQRVILYGSLVDGEPAVDSGIDLLIIKETDEPPLERRVHVRRLVSDLKRSIPFSPLVLTPDELTYRLMLGDPFYREIIQQGKTLYVRN